MSRRDFSGHDAPASRTRAVFRRSLLDNAARMAVSLSLMFDQPGTESATRRRMMVIGMHDRRSGHAARVRALDRFLTYARKRQDVWFAREDEIAKRVLETRSQTPVVERGPAGVTGLPGPSRSPLGKHLTAFF
ncbi:hypothetical protein EON79_15405 [bacterium]|nr:MAG: hypothetical protein EON79_15405 [bacterium]